jgi:hypothetical protein
VGELELVGRLESVGAGVEDCPQPGQLPRRERGPRRRWNVARVKLYPICVVPRALEHTFDYTLMQEWVQAAGRGPGMPSRSS